MKNLIVLSITLLMSLKGISQKDTQTDSIITISPAIARLVIKDLTLYDRDKEKIKRLLDVKSLYESKVLLQDEVIKNLNEQIKNSDNISNLRAEQIDNFYSINRQLKTDLKKQKIKNKLTTAGGSIIAIVLAGLLITN